MENVMLIGIDLGKHSFHVHGQDRQGKTLLRKKFSRPQLIAFLATFHPCTIVMEACAGAHLSWRGEPSPTRRRIDLSEPTDIIQNQLAKRRVTIDFFMEKRKY